MVTGLMIFHGVVSVLLIIVVLLQFGKGAEAGLLGGASEAVFTGSQQGNILSKITVVLTVLFLGNCILLAKIQTGKESKSLLDSAAPIAAPLNSDTTAPAQAPAEETKSEAAPAAK
ncbi:preprotein translocase subunit SecG [Halobacteriovorax sp. RZ-2]|uniref:preprotein translocase subunit SecG n=1 Tax=unclassified Halobacteriovorax TaxID=2639665 RepID=UPI00371DC9DA